MLANVTIHGVTQTARLTRGGQAIAAKQVMYTIGDHGPFTVAFTDAQYAPDVVATAMAREIVMLYHLGVPLQYPPKLVSSNPNVWQIPILPNPSDAELGSAALAPTGFFTYTEPPTA